MSSRIAILIFPGVEMLDVVGPADAFSAAARQVGIDSLYELRMVGTQPGLAFGSSGLRLATDRTIFDPDEPADTILVAGCCDIRPMIEDCAAHQWLVRNTALARRYGSMCNGTFALAAAGLLEGRRVTTHWGSAAKLAATYPNVTVEPDRIFVRDGRLYTSAGVTAGVDLALALIEEDHGRAVALAVARRLVMFLKRSGSQSQFSPYLAAQASAKLVIQEIQAWILDNL
ncbi:MAG: GlxA family transcriptional regulator, partial [Burkholderiales bacterium]